MERLMVESNESVIWLIELAFERLIICVYNIWCRNKHIWQSNSQNMILPSLIHACNHSATQNIATSAEGAFITLHNNCSLPPGSDCCHRNGKTTFGNTVAWTLKSKFEFLILNWLIGRKYLWFIDVSIQYQVWALSSVGIEFIFCWHWAHKYWLLLP